MSEMVRVELVSGQISFCYLQDEGRKTRLVSRVPAHPVEGGGETGRNESKRIHLFAFAKTERL